MLPVSYRKLKHIPAKEAAIFNGKYSGGVIFEPEGVYLPHIPYSKMIKAPISNAVNYIIPQQYCYFCHSIWI